MSSQPAAAAVVKCLSFLCANMVNEKAIGARRGGRGGGRARAPEQTWQRLRQAEEKSLTSLAPGNCCLLSAFQLHAPYLSLEAGEDGEIWSRRGRARLRRNMRHFSKTSL